MKILIIRFSSIGDIVLTTPVIRCLKEQTNAEIHYLTKSAFLPVLQHNPYIDKIHTLSSMFNQTLDELRSEEHTSERQAHHELVCRLLLEKKKTDKIKKQKKKTDRSMKRLTKQLQQQ